MYASYTGKKSRSLSTTDVYRIGFRQQEHDHDKAEDQESSSDEEMPPRMQPTMSFSTLGRQFRRPMTRQPPAPPKRADSFCSTTTTLALDPSLTEVRSYLSDDIRRQFESTANETTSTDSNSPRSSNFVKKLVATLERRQKDNGIGCKNGAVAIAGCTTTHDIYQKSFRELSRDDRSTIADVKPPTALDFSPRCKISQLEQLREADEIDDFDSSDDSDDYFSDMFHRQESIARPPTICTAYPVSSSSSSNAQSDKSKSSGKRSLKNVFSSLIHWRIGGKNLPKGSREYYTSRESLGEEMRAFRRDTMPRLMERAAVNSRLPDLFRKRTSERPRRETQDFAKLIKRPSRQREEPSPRSIATIHPVYGSSKLLAGSQMRLPGRESVNERLYSSSRLHHESAPPPSFELPSPETCATSPPLPPSIPATTACSPSYSDEHLLRPSRLRNIEKRLSHEIDCNVAAIQLRSSSVTYDVPRSNRPVVVQEYAPSSSTTHYQNIGQTISQDKRLSCTLFTTF